MTTHLFLPTDRNGTACGTELTAILGRITGIVGDLVTANRYDVTCATCASSPAAHASAIREAADMLDREEHRYVERFVPCPNGCEFEHRGAGQGSRPARTAGPDDCDTCDWGVIEDEDAPQIDPLIALLRAAADVIDGS